jgi:hypothetical protein
MEKLDYFARPEISNSKLGEFKRSPMHYKFFMDNVKKEKPEYIFGDASHTILFEPEKVNKKFFVLDENRRPEPESDYRNKKNLQWKSEMIEMNAGKKLITLSDYDMIMFMHEQLFKHKLARELILGSLYEQEVYFKDQTFGMACKAKIDIRKPGQYKADYKTTQSAEPYTFQKNAWKYDYYRQGAFYTDSEGPDEDFYFIAQEKTAPYAVSIHKCKLDLINYGRDEYIKLMTHLKACMDNDYWPGYEIKNILSDEEYFDFDIPAWVIQSM